MGSKQNSIGRRAAVDHDGQIMLTSEACTVRQLLELGPTAMAEIAAHTVADPTNVVDNDPRTLMAPIDHVESAGQFGLADRSPAAPSSTDAANGASGPAPSFESAL